MINDSFFDRVGSKSYVNLTVDNICGFINSSHSICDINSHADAPFQKSSIRVGGNSRSVAYTFIYHDYLQIEDF
jgi:hypothetical protein